MLNRIKILAIQNSSKYLQAYEREMFEMEKSCSKLEQKVLEEEKTNESKFRLSICGL